MDTPDMVIFTRTYDLLTWLLPHCERFPRAQRFVVTRRLTDAALDFQEHIIEANALPPGPARLARLQTADGDLGKLKLYLRLVFRWGWLTDRQYEFVSENVTEIGRLLGGWIRRTRQP
jgi:four helix bundle protein